MSKRFVWLTTATATAALLLAGGASAATPLPTLSVALTGAQGVSVSGSTVSGGVRIVSTFAGKLPPGSMGAAVGLVRLNPGVTLQQAVGAVTSHGGNLDGLTPYATLFADADAPGTFETVLTPGNYVALNLSGNGQPGFATFTVTQAASAATLPRPAAIERTIEFGFRGPALLHNGTIVRAENDGFLVHMNDLIGVPNARTGRKVIALLKAGKDRAAQKLATHSFVSLLGPASPGAMQQQVLNAKPGYYVEACFMDTGDGREHTVLGMERLVRIVK